ncbi:MAG: hypothetical protein M0Z95_17980 [Actinomycetota bacterium]|nr:hypothetical protein [Actinomycetota bacterium]
MRAVLLDVLGEHGLKVAAAEDEHPVDALAPHGGGHALTAGVGPGCSDRGLDDPGAARVRDSFHDRVRGLATGWRHGRLSVSGREQAQRLWRSLTPMGRSPSPRRRACRDALGFEHWINGDALSELAVSELDWKEGWEYRL